MIDAARVKEMREQLGESQAVFGVRFGVDQSTAHRWETDSPPKRGPALIALRTLDDGMKAAAAKQPAEQAAE